MTWQHMSGSIYIIYMRKRLDEIYTVISHSLGLIFLITGFMFIILLINLQLFLYSMCQILTLQAARI